MLRDHGQSKKYYHEIEGYNGRLDAIQAGILQTKLKRLAEWNGLRRTAASRYHEMFRTIGSDKLIVFNEPAWSRSVYHLFVVRVKNREELMKHFASVGIGTGIHYPIPLHLQNAYTALGYKRGDFPIAEQAGAEVLSLPIYPQIGGNQQMRVVSELKKFLAAEMQSLLQV